MSPDQEGGSRSGGVLSGRASSRGGVAGSESGPGWPASAARSRAWPLRRCRFAFSAAASRSARSCRFAVRGPVEPPVEPALLISDLVNASAPVDAGRASAQASSRFPVSDSRFARPPASSEAFPGAAAAGETVILTAFSPIWFICRNTNPCTASALVAGSTRHRAAASYTGAWSAAVAQW
jgi:hypothetical protein